VRTLYLALFPLAAALIVAQTARAPNIEKPEEAAQVEKALEANPDDLAARDRLLLYYSTRDPVTDAIRAARRRHILWLIEHHPAHGVHNTFVELIPPPPNPLADPEGEAEAAQLWRRQALRTDASPWAISHAVYFLYFHDRKFALQVLEEARRRNPSDAALAWAKGVEDALTITGATAVDTNGTAARFDTAIADSPAAGTAREELRITANSDLLSAAADSILKQFRPLFAIRPEFAHLVLDLAEGWIQRVVAMKPGDQSLEDRFAMDYLQASNFTTDETQKARLIERAAAHARASEWRVAALQYVVEFHFQSGEVERARGEAEEILRKAPEMYLESSRAYAAHIAHTVLGRIVLRQGRVAEAREQLTSAGKLASADITGWNGIRSNLASDLLARGQRDVVLDYISMVRAVSSKSKGQLDDWAKSIRAGETPDLGSAITDPAPKFVGKLATNFRLRNLDGQQVALSSYKGKVVLLDFWATWCGPCRAELPILEKLHREFAAKHAAIVTVDVGENAETVGKYVRGEKYTFPVLLDQDEEVKWQYGLMVFPSLVVIDKRGRVTDFIGGALTEPELRAALKRAGSAN
jgi:thiol-disulfide isomerase/thioredoxin